MARLLQQADPSAIEMPPFERAGAQRGQSWLDRCYALRDRLVASPRFQHWAASFPLTRPIARRRTRALFDICAGFVYSQVLAACTQLNLFEILAEGPKTAAALSGRVSLSPDACARLLKAAASLGLVSRRSGGRFGLGELGAALIGNPSIARMVAHHALLYADLNDPVALLRGRAAETELHRYWAYAGVNRPAVLAADQIADYTSLMSVSQSLVAREVIDAYRLDRHRCLLDVGGGDGAFLRAVARSSSQLDLMLFDLPPVAERARTRFAEAGLSERVDVRGGDFLADPLPAGADVVSLVRILHDHDDDAALAILRAVRRALPDEGALLIAEPMSGTPGAEPIGDAYFGFYLLAMGSGRPRRPGELKDMLRVAGFGRIRAIPTRNPVLTSLIVAHPLPLSRSQSGDRRQV